MKSRKITNLIDIIKLKGLYAEYSKVIHKMFSIDSIGYIYLYKGVMVEH